MARNVSHARRRAAAWESGLSGSDWFHGLLRIQRTSRPTDRYLRRQSNFITVG
ncbi:hypothetical protein ABZ446_26505 [Streptomyces sp. NPDC005813]|uniref:hypothetical protein n=1 Tax=Streptomyces sp. NPDC005813 TaxID=3155592 RepID=UPI00340E3C49